MDILVALLIGAATTIMVGATARAWSPQPVQSSKKQPTTSEWHLFDRFIGSLFPGGFQGSRAVPPQHSMTAAANMV
jgi:hypothetical protein